MESNKDGYQAGGEAGKDSGNIAAPALGALEFAQESARALARIEQGMIDAEVDAEVDFVSDGVLEVEFEDGNKMIVNRHEVSRQVWVAGRTGAFHFRWDGSGWVDTRSGEGLLRVVSRLASQMSGREVALN